MSSQERKIPIFNKAQLEYLEYLYPEMLTIPKDTRELFKHIGARDLISQIKRLVPSTVQGELI